MPAGAPCYHKVFDRDWPGTLKLTRRIMRSKFPKEIAMAASIVGRGWRRTLLLSAGLFLVSGLIAGNLPGQTKGKKEPAKKKEIKYIPDTLVAPSGQDQVGTINEVIQKGWADNKIKPSERCTDYEFIRRASLDIIGRIATIKEINQFMSWPERERRSRLIEHF